MKVCDKTCIFCFFPVINKYLCMAKRSLLSRCPRTVFREVTSYSLVAVIKFRRKLMFSWFAISPLNAELNPISHMLALVGAHHIVHVSRIRVKMEVVG